MPIVFIRKEATREIHKYYDPFPWNGDYGWANGNNSCDCNRYLYFERAAGQEPPWDGGSCGHEAYAVRVEDENGKELYSDERWKERLHG